MGFEGKGRHCSSLVFFLLAGFLGGYISILGLVDDGERNYIFFNVK